jgi:hypothetical protein
MNIQDYPKRDQNYHAACQLGWNHEFFWSEVGPLDYSD